MGDEKDTSSNAEGQRHTQRSRSWLVGWISWHINLSSLFYAKSIFIQVSSSISYNSMLRKRSFIDKNSSISNNSVQHKYTV